MASVASQLIDEVTAHALSDSLDDAREICGDGTYFPNNLRIILGVRSRKIINFPVSCIMQHRPPARSATAANLIRGDIDTFSKEIRPLAHIQR